MKKALKIIWRVFSIVLVVAVLTIMTVVIVQRFKGKEPQLFGYRINYVTTGSMSPEILAGDVIFCKDIDACNVKNGDIITYSNDGRIAGLKVGQTVCHKVIEEPYVDDDGVWHILTKGTANSVEDPELTGDQVIGKFVRKLKVLAAFYKVFLTKWGLLIIIIPLMAVLGIEIYRLTAKRNDADGEKSSKKEITGETGGTDGTDES